MQQRTNDPLHDPMFDVPPEADAELDLLVRLARGIDAAPAPAQVDPPRRKMDAAFEVFVETPLAPPVLRSAHLNVPHVDLDDLVEDLATTAAALRARRAA